MYAKLWQSAINGNFPLSMHFKIQYELYVENYNNMKFQ
jgi:hypothetical protein